MSVAYFLLLVGLLVATHELGHLIAAKLVGVKVVTFSLGFGPPLLRAQLGETELRLGCVPLGGYVRLLGEDPAERVPPEEKARAFSERALPARLAIVLAGPLANLLCPLLIYFYLFQGHTELPAAVLGEVFAGSPAAAAGLVAGDRVVEVDGDPIGYWEDFERAVEAGAGERLPVTVRRGEKELTFTLEPRRQTLRSRAGAPLERSQVGVAQARPRARIGVLDRGSPAWRAGLRTGDIVIAVAGVRVASFADLERALGRENRRATIAYLRPRQTHIGGVALGLYEPGMTDLVPDRIWTEPGRATLFTGLLSADLFVADVVAGSPAARAGLRAGDLVTMLGGEKVGSWRQFDQALLDAPERSHRIAWLRSGVERGASTHEAEVMQEQRRVVDEYGNARDELVLGARHEVQPGQIELVPLDGRFLYAARHAVERTVATIVETARGMVAILSGQTPDGSVGGPFMVYQLAAVSGAKGWDSFMLMVALISVNLGLLNLLPIPVLDGGHLLLFAVEAARRKRLSARVREAAVLAGLVVLVGLTLLALKNDLVRYVVDR